MEALHPLELNHGALLKVFWRENKTLLSPGFKTWPQSCFLLKASLTERPCHGHWACSRHLFQARFPLGYIALSFCSWEWFSGLAWVWGCGWQE